MTSMRDQLIAEARKALEHSYSPYSKFSVGAALLDEDGNIHHGTNVENASLGLTICAERTAVFRAVADGCQRFQAIAIVTPTPHPTAPCGACRQVLLEFANPDLTIWLAGEGDTVEEHLLSDLVPLAFRSFRDEDSS